MIQEQILNEEGQWSRPSTSLNKVALNKRKSDKPTYKCYYCQKAGHKANECQKKKKDVEEKDKKDKAAPVQTPSKVVNAHIVPTTAMISEITDDNDIWVSIYAAMQSQWMVDSGAMHHISPYQLDFMLWTTAQGTVSLGSHAEIEQIGSRTVVINLTRGDQKVQITLENV